MEQTKAYIRWYDKDPTVSLAISILRNTSEVNQLFIAEILIKHGERQNIELKPNYSLFNRRWYDHNERLSEAIEYLRMFSEEEQKRASIEIIEQLCNLDCICNTI